MKDLITITIPPGYSRIEGHQADVFRDMFAQGVVAKEKENGPEKVKILMEEDKYIIITEMREGMLEYRVTFGQEEDSFIAIGPNLTQQLLTDATPFFRFINQGLELEPA